jgi:hypothetical protein
MRAGQIPTSWTTSPPRRPAAGPEQLQPLQVIGGELDPSEIVGDGLRAACVSCIGWVGAHGRVPLVATLSHDRAYLKVEREWVVVCLVTETSPDDLGVSGSMGRCPPDHGPAAGTGHHPTGMISRRPRPGRISPPKGAVSLTQGDGW